MKNNTEKFDVAVVGGGPAGMMSAIQASAKGARVILIEKNNYLGVKFLMTGKGRCNITNNSSIENIIEKIGKSGRFLFSALHQFGPADVIDFFKKKNVPLKTERGQRVFPQSDQAKDVLKILLQTLKKNEVTVRTNVQVRRIIQKNNLIYKLVLNKNKTIFADKFIICTGGKSYPTTGSTGDGYEWLEKLGHTIIPLTPALTPIIIQEKIPQQLEGLNLKNVTISFWKNNKKIISQFGEAIFTAKGMSGPIIIKISKILNSFLPANIQLVIDFKPKLNYKQLDKRLQRDFQKFNNKFFKNSLEELLPKKLIPVVTSLSKINSQKKVNLITKEERKKLMHLIKEFTLTVKSVVGFEKAIITSGGISLKEVNSQTMQSKIFPNLFLAGEILDLDGPTGGYNLQICWSTGYVAGQSASQRVV